MNQWYYSSNGKAQGPVTSEFLIENLRKGQLTLVDLVFRSGDAGWITIGEVPEFRSAFNALPLQTPPPPVKEEVASALEPFEIHSFKKLISMADSRTLQPLSRPSSGWPRDWQLSSSWIVLKRRDDGSGFDQDGPFSAEQIIEMIGQGKVEYSQYCWKPGYTRWFRIGNLPEFDRRKRDRDNDTVNQIVAIPEIREALPALTREELLSGVERLRQSRKVQEAAPAETDGRDLVKNAIDVTPPVIEPVVASPVIPNPVIESVPTPVPAMNQTKPEAKSGRSYLRIGVAGAIAGLVVVALLQYVDRKDEPIEPALRKPAGKQQPRKNEPQNEPSSPASPDENVSDPSSNLPQESGGVSPAAAPTVAQNPGSTIEILPLKLTSAPSLTFQTDAGVGQTIDVVLSAKTGEILRYGSYYETFHVVRSPGEIPTLDLAKLELPPGTYWVSANVGSAHAEKEIFIGVKGPEFLSQLERHIKGLSYRQQVERKSMFYGSQKLADLTQRLIEKSRVLKGQPKSWKKELAVWRVAAKEASMPVLQLAMAPRNETAYFSQLAAFQAASEKLAALANELDAAIEQKREIASSEADSVLMAFNQIQTETANLSGRPKP